SFCWQRLSPTCSSRDAGSKPRICFCAISSTSPCGGRHFVCGCTGGTGRYLYGSRGFCQICFTFSRGGSRETILRWHRAGFKAFWRWKSRHRAGRPKIDREVRDLIQQMSKESPLWGAPRIHGELLKLGFEVAESTPSPNT